MAKKNNKNFSVELAERMENSKQMKLVNRIDKLKWRVNMATEMIEIKKEMLDEHREKKVNELANSLKKKLYNLELSVSNVDDIEKEYLSLELKSFEDKQKLAFRAFRQSLRREEGVVDKAGKVIPGKELSDAATAKLDEFSAKQAEDMKAFLGGIRQKAEAAALSGDALNDAKKKYDALVKEKDAKVAALDAELTAKNDKAYEAYTIKSKANIAKWKEETQVQQDKLNAMMSSDTHDLPDDVVLRLEHLTMQFGGLKAVNDLSFDVKKGEIFGLIGPNGAGKTTVFNCITQFYKPTSGEVYYRNKENKVISLNSYKVHDVIKTGIVRTFQNVEVIAELTILQNLLIAAHTQYKSNIFAQMLNTKSVKQEEAVLYRRALKVLEYCDLTELKDVPPVGLPYGILKRIELARTLMAGANLIILDEPAAGLNDQETKELSERIKRIRNDFNATIFLVEHDMGLVMDICEHICAISFGKKLAYGTPEEIQKDPAVQEAYLGTNDKEAK